MKTDIDFKTKLYSFLRKADEKFQNELMSDRLT